MHILFDGHDTRRKARAYVSSKKGVSTKARGLISINETRERKASFPARCFLAIVAEILLSRSNLVLNVAGGRLAYPMKSRVTYFIYHWSDFIP